MSWKEKYGRETTKTLSAAKPRSGNNRVKITDKILVHQWTKKDWDTMRLIGPLHSYGFHTVTTYGKDGTKYEFQKQCLKYNPETQERDLDEDCPYCNANYKFRQTYFHNAIDRALQENEPKKPNPPTKAELKSGFKDIDSASWTPVVVLRMPPSLVINLQNYSKLAKKNSKSGEAHSVADVEHGVDINFFFDPDGTGDGMYKTQMGDKTPITDEEGEYLIWNLEDQIKPESFEEAEAEIARFVKACAEHGDGEAPAEESDSRSRSKKSRHADTSSSSSRNKRHEPDEEDDEDDEDEESFVPEEGDRVTVTDKDGEEVAVGTVTAINSKKVIVETDDGDAETYFLSRVTLTPAPAKKGKGKKAPEPEPEEEEEDEDTPEFSEGDRVQVLDEDGDEVAVGTIESIDTKKVVITDEDDEPHTFKFAAGFTLKAAPARKTTGKKKPEPEPEEDEDEAFTPEEGDRIQVVDSDDEDDVKVIGVVTEITSRKVTVEDDEGDDHTFKLSEVTLQPAPVKKAVKGKKAPPPEDDDDEDDIKPSKKNTGKKKPDPDEDEDDDDIKPSKKPAAGKKKFNFDDDDE